MPTMRAVLVALLTLCTVASHAASQRVPTVGERVRVRTAGLSAETVGTVQSISSSGIEVVDTKQHRVFVVAQSIRDLEVSQGQRMSEGNDGLALVTLVAVTGAGAAFGAAAWSPCTETGWFACFLHPGSRGRAATVGAAVAFPIGLIFASSIGKDRLRDEWVTATLPAASPGASIGLFRGATEGDIGLGISLPFGGR